MRFSLRTRKIGMYWWEYAPGASQHVPFVSGTGPSSLVKSWATNVMLPSQIWWWNIPGLTVSPCLAVVKVRILAAGAACMLCRLIMPAYHSIRQQRISRLAKKASVFYVWSGIWGSAVCVGGFPRRFNHQMPHAATNGLCCWLFPGSTGGCLCVQCPGLMPQIWALFTHMHSSAWIHSGMIWFLHRSVYTTFLVQCAYHIPHVYSVCLVVS